MRSLMLLVLVGCPAATPTTVAPAECATIDVAACSSTPGCAAIQGYTLNPVNGDWCEGERLAPVAIGCQAAEASCPAVEVYGHSPQTPEIGYVVPAGCLPEGWTSLDGPFETCPNNDCSDSDDCSAPGCMPVLGRALQGDAPDLCLDFEVDPVQLACMPEQGCGDAETYVVHDAITYWLPNTCVPDGIEVVDDVFPECE